MLKLFYLSFIVLFLNLASAESFDTHQPENMSDDMWASFKSALPDNILSPSPEGIGAENGYFGASVAIDGNRAAVGVPNIGQGLVVVLALENSAWEIEKVLVPPGISASKFGGSVSISGNRIIVGDQEDQYFGFNSGAAYVFEWNGSVWLESQLIATDLSDNYGFGNSVDISGDRALVGALFGNFNNSFTGAVYIFDWNGTSWVESKLTPSDSSYKDLFGSSVSVNGDRILVGAPGKRQQNLFDVGAAYIFDWDGNAWAETKLEASDAVELRRFGSSVSLAGDNVLIGAWGDDENGSNSGAAYLFQNSGNDWLETKITASDGAEGDGFGEVDIIDGKFVIGASGGDDAGDNSGSIYVFEWVNDVLVETKLTANDASEGDFFGGSVSAYDDLIITGAPGVDDNGTNTGAVYILQSDGIAWNETKHTIPTGSSGDNFGYSISYSDERVIVGAPFDDENGSFSGSASIFDWDGNNWQATKILPNQGTEYASFGISVSIYKNRAVVGAFEDVHNGVYSGAAYIFDWNGGSWNETKISPSDGLAYDSFGSSVSMAQDRLLVGSPFNDENGDGSGAIYIYDWNGNNWLETKITSTDGSENDKFGYSVSVFENRAVVGASNAQTNGAYSGAAYVLDWDGSDWSETKLIPSDGATGQGFGEAVSVFGDRLLVGASTDNENGIYSGAAYVFDLVGNDWQESKLLPREGVTTELYGQSVAVDEDRILIGTAGVYDKNGLTETVFLYDWDGSSWNESMLSPADSNDSRNINFGRSVALSANMAFIGAPTARFNGISETGLAYIYQNPDVIFVDGFDGNKTLD